MKYAKGQNNDGGPLCATAVETDPARLARMKLDQREGEVRKMCMYSAFNVPQNDDAALAEAKKHGVMGLVRVRLCHGAIELLAIDNAVRSICGGWATLDVNPPRNS